METYDIDRFRVAYVNAANSLPKRRALIFALEVLGINRGDVATERVFPDGGEPLDLDDEELQFRLRVLDGQL
jgi:hypothetical protein